MPEFYTETFLTRRPLAGLVIHDTETDVPASPGDDPPRSWHDQLLRDGTIRPTVDYADVAWHVRAADRWRPPWLPATRPWDASDVNCHTVGLEIVNSQKYRDQGWPYTQAQYAALQRWLLDRRADFGPLPVVGHGHLQSDRTDPVWLDWAAVIAVMPEVDRWMPLEGATRTDPLEGGFAFCEWTGLVYHPGVDLNAGPGGDSDLGLPVRVPMGGVVRFVGFDKAGYGNHLWLESDTGHWHHLCHLQFPPFAAVGSRVDRGARVGYCGKSGGWAWAHVHWEVTYSKPGAWSQWPVGWSKDRVLNTYMDPFAYLSATWPDGTENGPVMETPVLNDAELAHKQMAAEWGQYYPGDGGVDFAIPSRWRAELRQGRQLGSPVGPEMNVPDVENAVYQEFEHGVIYARLVDGAWKTSLVG